MRTHVFISMIVAIALLLTGVSGAMAQDVTPNVQVAPTGIVDDAVTIVEATVTGPAWVVIHADDDGAPGPVIGYAPLEEGVNSDVAVEIDVDAATPILHAMLHVDEGEVGTFEFPGPDGPVTVGDAIVMAQFSANPVPAAEEDMAEGEDMAGGEDMAAPETMPMTGGFTPMPYILVIAGIGLLAFGANILTVRRRA